VSTATSANNLEAEKSGTKEKEGEEGTPDGSNEVIEEITGRLLQWKLIVMICYKFK
jgi:hypothetical protein